MYEYDEEYEPDPDYYFDMVRDDFLTIEDEREAIDMIHRYPSMIRYLPEQYKYLLQYTKELK